MIAFKTNYRVLTWLCVCPLDESTSERLKILIRVFAMSVFLANVCATATAVAFFRRSISIDMEGSLYSLVQIAGSSSTTYTMIVAFILRTQITEIFMKLSKIKNDDSFEFMERASNQSEWMWGIYFKTLIGFAVNITTTAIASVLYCTRVHGHFDANDVYHPYKFV